jgi:hypothetical protein
MENLLAASRCLACCAHRPAVAVALPLTSECRESPASAPHRQSYQSSKATAPVDKAAVDEAASSADEDESDAVGSDMEESSSGGSTYGENGDERTRYADQVVGWRVSIWWPAESQWFQGTVASFVRGHRLHLVKYDDGDERLERLDKLEARGELRWLAPPLIVTSVGGASSDGSGVSGGDGGGGAGGVSSDAQAETDSSALARRPPPRPPSPAESMPAVQKPPPRSGHSTEKARGHVTCIYCGAVLPDQNALNQHVYNGRRGRLASCTPPPYVFTGPAATSKASREELASEAIRTAEAEGLTLVRANSFSGYRCVAVESTNHEVFLAYTYSHGEQHPRLVLVQALSVPSQCVALRGSAWRSLTSAAPRVCLRQAAHHRPLCHSRAGGALLRALA